MKHSDWAQKDYEIARAFIEDHEELASKNPLLDCGQGVTAILPLEVPGLGFRLHGLIMLAPLPLFIVCAILVPIFGFSGNWEISLTTISITFGCAIMILGLFRAIRLVVGQRETFPRQYFSTIGPQGLSMHFSRLQIPFCNPRQELLWKNMEHFELTKIFFLPGILIFKPMLSAVSAKSKEGTSVILPAPYSQNGLSRLQNLLNSSQR